jgi:hypothetical protein
MFFPEDEGPKSLDRSILIVRTVPSTVISTFFIASLLAGTRPAAGPPDARS